jgi:hypothetical protein
MNKEDLVVSHIQDKWIPAAPVYGFYIFQLIRYSRFCGSYQDFLDIGLLLTKCS